ncbi:MAG: ATP-binding cassette domain-containing protein [Ilumatobacteraceae bacterium]
MEHVTELPTPSRRAGQPAIEAVGLRKRYTTKHGVVTALDGLDLTAESGQVTAVLGPNGAGKSTLVGAVATLLRTDGGQLRVGGIDVARHPDQVRRVIGLAGQYAAVEPAMTGRENLVMVARLFGHDRRAARAAAAIVLGQIDLQESADRLVREYSGGMRRRLDLGASLVGAPRLLLLDEPTTGLDPRSRIDLWGAIRALVQGGTDVLLTTQYLEEADQLADRITIVDHGRAIASGTPDELKGLAGSDVIEVRVRHSADVTAVHDVLAAFGTERPRVDEPTRKVAVPVADGSTRLAEAVRVLAERHLDFDDIGLRRPTLDEVFLTLTGNTGSAGSAADAA